MVGILKDSHLRLAVRGEHEMVNATSRLRQSVPLIAQTSFLGTSWPLRKNRFLNMAFRTINNTSIPGSAKLTHQTACVFRSLGLALSWGTAYHMGSSIFWLWVTCVTFRQMHIKERQLSPALPLWRDRKQDVLVFFYSGYTSHRELTLTFCIITNALFIRTWIDMVLHSWGN